MPDKPLPESIAGLVSPATIPSIIPPLRLPTFTFLIGVTDEQSDALITALVEQDNSLYIEGFKSPLDSAVAALLDKSPFGPLRETPEWDKPIYSGGPQPVEIAHYIGRKLSDILSFEILAALRVKDNEGFNKYQYLFPDATGFNLELFLAEVGVTYPETTALVLRGDVRVPVKARTLVIDLPNPSNAAACIAQLRRDLGTL